MTNPRGRRTRAVGWLGLAAVVLAESSSSQVIYLAHDPETYTSPSGRYALHVNPSDRGGAGAATYRLTRDGALVWKGDKPFTLWEGAVADDGTVGGYSYSHGLEGHARGEPGYGDIQVVVLDPTGNSRSVESVARGEALFIHGDPTPVAHGVFIDGDGDRLVIRVSEKQERRAIQSWWTYRLSSGVSLGHLHPLDEMSVIGFSCHDFDAKKVVETPLVLVHWLVLSHAGADEETRSGSRFTLIDESAKPVWTLDLLDDYSRNAGKHAGVSSSEWVRRHGAIVRWNEPRRFTIRHVKERMLVTYSVERDKSVSAGWRVMEVGRVEDPDRMGFSSDTGPSSAPASEVANLSLRHLGTIQLDTGGPPNASPIDSVFDFCIDDGGRFGFVRPTREGSRDKSFVVVDGVGALVREVVLPASPADDEFRFHTTWVKGDRWVVTRSNLERSTKTAAWWIDVAKGETTSIEGFDGPFVATIAGSRDGGFIVAGKRILAHTWKPEIQKVDSNGKIRWKVDETSPRPPSPLISDGELTVISSGDVVVLQGNELLDFGTDGAFKSATMIPKTWNPCGEPPRDVRADLDGGVILSNILEHAASRVKLDGSLVSVVTPQFASGQTFSLLGGVQVAPDGHLWTADGHSLLRLDLAGTVDLALGKKPDSERFDGAVAMHVDPRGRIYALAGRTGAAHVFDADGNRVRILRPAPGDFAHEIGTGSICANDRGEVFCHSLFDPANKGPQFLKYSATGERLGMQSLDVDPVSQDWLWIPGSDRRWVVGYESLFLIDADGKTIRKVERAPGDTWLQDLDEAAVCADGSIAIAARRRGEGPEPDIVVHVFTATGDPVRSFEAPAGTAIYSPLAFDGKRFAFVADSKSGGSAVIVTDALGKPLFRFAPDSSPDPWRPFITAGGRELWLYRGKTTIEKYALP